MIVIVPGMRFLPLNRARLLLHGKRVAVVEAGYEHPNGDIFTFSVHAEVEYTISPVKGGDSMERRPFTFSSPGVDLYSSCGKTVKA